MRILHDLSIVLLWGVLITSAILTPLVLRRAILEHHHEFVNGACTGCRAFDPDYDGPSDKERQDAFVSWLRSAQATYEREHR